MTKYRSKKTVEAVRWWKMGDCIGVGSWDRGNPKEICFMCGHAKGVHGLTYAAEYLNRHKVCPGSYVMLSKLGNDPYVWPSEAFEAEYSEVADE